MQRHLRLGGEQAHDDLVTAHLEGEDDAGETVLDRGGSADIKAQGRLAERWSCRDDDELAGVKAVRQFVELNESGGNTDHLATAVRDRLDLVQGLAHDVAQRKVILARAAIGDVVDLGLRAVDHVVDITGSGVAHLHDSGAGLDEAAQDCLLADDAPVIAAIRGCRHHGDERVEVGGAADAGDVTALRELGSNGHRVSGLALAVKIEDGAVDGLVGRAVEIAFTHDLDDIGDGILAQEHGPNDRLLGSDVVRWCPILAP
ncbi:unannotated protein [freshwater metagenome]|uniref:Unannotated protein n=1 Tax=freshwater metagenome TaxID=449393 RepID=A0A6J7J1X0_9ZZZZ